MHVKDLTPTSKRVEITLKLISRNEPRYAKGFKITTFIAADATGQVSIPFWNKEADLVKVGDFITIQNGYVSVFREKLQLNVGKYGSFQVIPPLDNFDVNPAPAVLDEGLAQEAIEVVLVESLERQTKNLTLRVFIKSKEGERMVHTKNDGREHRVATFLVGDATGCILLNLWDELIDLIEVGSTVLISGGYVRIFRGQRLLNITRYGKMVPISTPIQINVANNLSEKVDA